MFSIIVAPKEVCYSRLHNQNAFRACTGFDGGFEVEEAIRRLRDCVPTWNLNINANNNRVALAA